MLKRNKDFYKCEVPYDLVVDLRKINDSGIGVYIKNVVLEVISILSKNYRVVAITRLDCDEAFLSEKIPSVKLLKFNSTPYTLFEQIEFLFRMPKSSFFWATSLSTPFFFKGKIVFTIYDLSYLYLKNISFSIFLKKIVTWAYLKIGAMKTSLYLFISEFSKNEFVKHFHFSIMNDAVLRVALLGVSDFTRSLSNIDIQEKYLIIIGNLRPHKNMVFAIKALEGLCATHGFYIYIIGDLNGQRMKDFKLLDYIGGKQWIKYLGKLSDKELHSIVKNANMLVAPSLHEGFGLTVLEGMAAGVPVLASNIPAHVEVGGTSIRYFDPYSEYSLASSALDILTNPSEAKYKSKIAKERAALFSWDKCSSITFDEIERLIKKFVN